MIKNIIANFIGRFWSIFSNFLFIPFYIKYLGIESYSLISFTIVITGMFAILDSGLTATLSRELASGLNERKEKVRILLTLETFYFIIVLISILLVFSFSELIAANWLNLNLLSTNDVKYYLRIISIGVGFQLLATFYSGGLFGLEYQVKANIYQIVWGIFRNGLVIIILIYHPTLELFFIWQTITTVIYAFVLRISLFKMMDTTTLFFSKPRIEKNIVLKVWKFAGGMLLISVVAGINTQLDKLVISKLLSIESLGYYTLAVTISLFLITIINPISTAILPRLTLLYTAGNNSEANELFFKIFNIVVVLIFTIASLVSFNSYNLLWIWTGDYKIVQNTMHLVPILAISMAMLSVAMIPYTVAIANGYTKLNNYLGLLSLIITIPGYFVFIKSYGAIGAAYTYSVVQTIITIVFVYFINKKYLQKKSKELFFKYFIKPAIVSLLFGFLFSLIAINDDNRFLLFCIFCFELLLSLFLSSILLIGYNNIKSSLSSLPIFRNLIKQ